MTLFLDEGGDSATAFANLYTISWQDGGLGEDSVPGDPTASQVTYQETAGQPATADRLDTLINTAWADPIVITALNGGIDPYSGLDVTGNGFTYIDSNSGRDIIRVVYDIGQCNGNGIQTFDTAGNPITTPNPVLLYHELSHAFRAATGTTQPNDEPPAETDENIMRSELGLCLRDVDNHNGGCGGGSSCGGSDGNTGCFIVSAATGTSQSGEVVRLRQIRDRVVRATALGRDLMNAVYRDYYQFSPAVAEDLRRDPVLREQVLVLLVNPLLAWYSLAEVLALSPRNATAATVGVERLTRACITSSASPSDTAAAFAQIIQQEEPVTHSTMPAVIYFERIAAQIVERPFSRWAIADPIAKIWAAQASDNPDFVAAVQRWFADVPLDQLDEPATDILAASLPAIAAGPAADPATRRRLGRRLSAAWPGKRQILAIHGLAGETEER